MRDNYNDVCLYAFESKSTVLDIPPGKRESLGNFNVVAQLFEKLITHRFLVPIIPNAL